MKKKGFHFKNALGFLGGLCLSAPAELMEKPVESFTSDFSFLLLLTVPNKLMECWTHVSTELCSKSKVGTILWGLWGTKQYGVMHCCKQVIWYLGGGVAILPTHVLDLGLGAFHRAVCNIPVRLRITAYFTHVETKGLVVT